MNETMPDFIIGAVVEGVELTTIEIIDQREKVVEIEGDTVTERLA